MIQSVRKNARSVKKLRFGYPRYRNRWDPRISVFQDVSFSVFCKKSPDNRDPITINWRAVRDRSSLRRRRGRRTVAIVTHTTSVDPIALAGRLLSTRTPGLVGRLIEWIAMRRVPHPVTAWRGGRTRGRVTRNERLARRGRRGRHRLPRCRGCGCGFARSLLKCRRRLDAADLINSIMK